MRNVLDTPNTFNSHSAGAPPMPYSRGGWLNYRKYASPSYLPNRWERNKLRDGRPFILSVPWSLGPQQTLEFQTSAPQQFAIAKICGQSLPGLSAQFTIYDADRKRLLIARPSVQRDFAGIAGLPFILTHPYPLQPNGVLLVRAANQETVPNQGELNFHGVLVDDIDLGSPPTGMGLPTQNYQPVQNPPWNQRPANGEPFSPSAGIAIPPAGQMATILEFTVPQGRSGVIKSYAFGPPGFANWNNGSGGLIFQILQNGVPFKNYDHLIFSLGQVVNIAGLRLHENDVISFVVLNVNVPAVGQVVNGFLEGYYYPKELDPPDSW